MFNQLDLNNKVIGHTNIPNLKGFSTEDISALIGDYIINGKAYTPPDSVSIPVVDKKKGIVWVVDEIAQTALNNANIKIQLAELDTKATRAIRSILSAGSNPNANDVDQLKALEDQASILRNQLK